MYEIESSVELLFKRLLPGIIIVAKKTLRNLFELSIQLGDATSLTEILYRFEFWKNKISVSLKSIFRRDDETNEHLLLQLIALARPASVF